MLVFIIVDCRVASLAMTRRGDGCLLLSVVCLAFVLGFIIVDCRVAVAPRNDGREGCFARNDGLKLNALCNDGRRIWRELFFIRLGAKLILATERTLVRDKLKLITQQRMV